MLIAPFDYDIAPYPGGSMLQELGNSQRLEAVRPSGADLRIVESRLLRRALVLCRSLPKGKGAMARLLGRSFLPRSTVLKARMPAGFDMLWTSASVDALVGAQTIGWDEHVLQTLLPLIGANDVVYDIGANAGYMALSVAQRHPGARVVAFEPLPVLANALVAAAQLNDFRSLSVVQAVLTDTDGEMEFYLPTHSIHASLKSREATATRLTVKAFALDSLVESGEIPPPDVIKIDVEGAEFDMLRGAQAMLRKHLPALVFECDENSKRFGSSPSEVVNFLYGLGYSDIARLRQGSTERDRIMPGDDSVGYGDFVATVHR